jgi:hypothetical protein
MIKASVLLMLALTVLIAMGLRWREGRMASPALQKPRRTSLGTRFKTRANRWVNAAAIAVLVTILIMGGLQWLKVWQG